MIPSAVILLNHLLVAGDRLRHRLAWLAWRTYSACALKPWSANCSEPPHAASCSSSDHDPALKNVRTETEPAVVAVLADLSASMEDNPLEARQTRAQRAVDFIDSPAFRQATKDCRILYFGMGAELEENVTPENMAFTAPKSLLTPALMKTASRLRAENLAAVIVLSDGLDQSGQSLDSLAMPAPALIPELEDPGAPGQAARTLRR